MNQNVVERKALLLRGPEVADALGISRALAYRWMATGEAGAWADLSGGAAGAGAALAPDHPPATRTPTVLTPPMSACRRVSDSRMCLSLARVRFDAHALILWAAQ